MSRYSEKRRERQQQAALTSGVAAAQQVAAAPAPVPRTLVEIAQGMQPCVTFACFAFEGEGATLFLDTAGLIFEHQGDKLTVVEANDKRLVGVFIWFSELRKLAEAGTTEYLPKAETSWSEDLENKRAYILSALLQAIAVEGGHTGVLTVLESLRAAALLREAIANKSQDLLLMFDKKGTHTFFIEIGGKPMEFRSGHFETPTWKEKVRSMRQVFGIKLKSAPLGTPSDAYKVGGYVVLEHLFSNTPPSNEVGAMMADLITLFEAEGKLEEAKAAVVAIGGTILESVTAADPVDDDAPGIAAEVANDRAMRVAVHGPNPVAKCAPADLVAHAAMVEAESMNGEAVLH